MAGREPPEARGPGAAEAPPPPPLHRARVRRDFMRASALICKIRADTLRMGSHQTDARSPKLDTWNLGTSYHQTSALVV
jgi:hypothetical protein